jgi:hypothetical protein
VTAWVFLSVSVKEFINRFAKNPGYRPVFPHRDFLQMIEPLWVNPNWYCSCVSHADSIYHLYTHVNTFSTGLNGPLFRSPGIRRTFFGAFSGFMPRNCDVSRRAVEISEVIVAALAVQSEQATVLPALVGQAHFVGHKQFNSVGNTFSGGRDN